MKKIKDAKKLQLHTETIQTLTPDELNDVPGGDAENQGGGASTLQSSCLVICSRRPTCCPMF